MDGVRPSWDSALVMHCGLTGRTMSRPGKSQVPRKSKRTCGIEPGPNFLAVSSVELLSDRE